MAQVFEIFKGDQKGQNATVTTAQFGLIHGVVIPTLDQFNIKFLIGKKSFHFFLHFP